MRWVTVDLGIMQYSVFAALGVCCTHCSLMIIAWGDIQGCLHFVISGDGRDRERWEKMGEIVMRNWDLREFRVWVNLPFLIWQLLLPIRLGKIPIRGHLNPIGQIVPLTVHIRSYPSYCSHYHSLSRFLYHHRRTQRLLIPLYLSMPWSWVNTEHGIHHVQHTLSTAYTQDCLSSLHSDDWELTPKYCFSIGPASLHDRPPALDQTSKVKSPHHNPTVASCLTDG